MRFSRRQFLGLAGVAALTSCARVKQTRQKFAVGKPGEFTFATISDVHVLDARSTAIVNRAVQQINADERIRFTVVLGDVATDGKLSELQLAKNSFDKLERPYYVVPGNHDVFARSREPFANYEQVFGETQWVKNRDGWLLIGLNSCEGAKSDVSIQPENIAWLEKRLRKLNKSSPIALFCHHPFNPTTKKYRVANADEVLGLFAEHNLKLVAAGHWHGNQVEMQNGVLFTTTACCTSTRPNFDDTKEKGYRLFHVTGESLDTEFVPVRE
jgi:3',5'-cyclic AMP phosphodiesterase CpdA